MVTLLLTMYSDIITIYRNIILITTITWNTMYNLRELLFDHINIATF